jgi:hypothetical protein
MTARGVDTVEVTLRPQDRDMARFSWVEPENFNPGYLLRGEHLLPRRGEATEWRHTQDYWAERKALPAVDLEGPEFRYGRAAVTKGASGLATAEPA